MMTGQKKTDFPSSTLCVQEAAVVWSGLSSRGRCMTKPAQKTRDGSRRTLNPDRNGKTQNSRVQSSKILHTSVYKYEDKCRSVLSNHAQPYRTNIRCTFNRPWSSAGPQPVCYHRGGWSVWQNRAEAGTLNASRKFLHHIQNQQMRSSSPPVGEYGPFLLVKYVKSINSVEKKKHRWKEWTLKTWKKETFNGFFNGCLSAAQLEPEHPCGGRKPTRELSWWESYRRRKNMERKILYEKKKKYPEKEKQRRNWNCFSKKEDCGDAAAARSDFTSVWS